MTATAYECSPEQLDERLGQAQDDAPLVVDFDETLWLRNSTEAYLDSLRPRWLAAPILWALDVLKPWKYLGGQNVADWVRVLLVSLLFPWTLFVWRRKAGHIGKHYENERLSTVLRERRATRIVIATQGFGFIVRPLLASMRLPPHELVACRFWRGRGDRVAGKVAMMPSVAIDQSVVITDSPADLELLQRAAHPLLVRWPEAEYIRALQGVYVPMHYTETIKRPGEFYMLHGVLLEDWMFWVLATVLLSGSPLLHVLGLLFLQFSFWCIYETGYVENDRVAHRYEDDPVLSKNFGKKRAVVPSAPPWLWALGTGAIGAWLLRPDDVFAAFAAWTLLLVALRLLYWGYNHIDKNTRGWLFPILQTFRSFAPIALVPVGVAGALALAAHAWCRSTTYLYYRMIGGEFPAAAVFLMRLGLFCLLFFGAWLADAALDPLEVLGLVLWALFRARRELLRVASSARHITVEPPA